MAHDNDSEDHKISVLQFSIAKRGIFFERKHRHTCRTNSQQLSRTIHGFPLADHSHFMPWGTITLCASAITLCGESVIVLEDILICGCNTFTLLHVYKSVKVGYPLRSAVWWGTLLNLEQCWEDDGEGSYVWQSQTIFRMWLKSDDGILSEITTKEDTYKLQDSPDWSKKYIVSPISLMFVYDEDVVEGCPYMSDEAVRGSVQIHN